MSHRQILFSGPMVRALLDGRKTQTRRVVKPKLVELIEWFAGDAEDDTVAPSDFVGLNYYKWFDELKNGKHVERGPEWLLHSTEYPEEGIIPVGRLHGAPGDHLWVRETWAAPDYCDEIKPSEFASCTWYRADDSGPFETGAIPVPGEKRGRWRPSIHMPYWASRITLRISDVRVERLQEISEADAKAEGIQYSERLEGYTVEEGNFFHCSDPRRSFEGLWESINGPDSWDENPWVWVIEFEVIPKNLTQYLLEN